MSTMERTGIYPLDNQVRAYPWGSTDFIPTLIGRPPTDEPAAELWMGAHPSAPSVLLGSDRTLADLVAARSEEMLGAPVVERFGPRLPFLFKVLAAEQPLSIQAHPTIAQAEAGFDEEEARGVPIDAPERNYVDRNHKPELICALTEFDALCGFRPVAETADLLARLVSAGADGLAGYAERLVGDGGLRDVVTSLLTMPAQRQQGLVASVTPAAHAIAVSGGRWSAECGWTDRIAARYPTDIGVLLALLMNLVRLQPGEALFLAAGQIHAYLHGAGMELMASSDNVLRCGLTGKHVDPPELLRVLDFTDEVAQPMPGVPNGVVRTYPVPVPDFALGDIELSGDDVVLDLSVGPQIIMCHSGRVEVSGDANFLEAVRVLRAGESAFVPANSSLAIRGAGRLFRATTNLAG